MVTLVTFLYTGLITCLDIIVKGGGSNLYRPEEWSTFTEEDIQERIRGSKVVVISEQAMLNVIWVLKFCVLFVLARMTVNTKYSHPVIFVRWCVGFAWLGAQLAFFTTCRPFEGYWAMPPPDPNCATLETYAKIQAAMNLGSDIAIIAIPMPMIWSLKAPFKQKMALMILFSMGAFVIIAAILTKVFNLTDVNSPAYMQWYVREASVAVYVANLPGIWPLLLHIPFLRSIKGSADRGPSYLPQYQTRAQTTSNRQATQKDDEIELQAHSLSGSTASSSMRPVEEEMEEEEEERVGHFRLVATLKGMRKGSPASDQRELNEGGGWGAIAAGVNIENKIEVNRDTVHGTGIGKGRFGWEVATLAPKVRIEGPDGSVKE
ncbi:hypothetical protein K469DRAFT_628661 [Zopfia rhizophila CBS 207.26]|uniref:Rhodopsin domain-containing protein n=1 Tax=Zopfia rhizophila CBS 207.26 TaxID=1314779 RepID=A0A6A6E7E4_9PEZI|nr:hypothetical protein K469DRAFT_628661 [Zopfia rhizophila CBS 207.26]